MKVVKMLAAVMAAGVMTGCAASAPGYVTQMEGTVPQAVATEPAATQMQAPTEVPTVAPTEAAAPFEVGQQVFCVYEHAGGVGVRRGFFVDLEDEIVVVTTAVPDSDEEGELLRFPVADCCADSADAWAAAGKQPLE